MNLTNLMNKNKTWLLNTIDMSTDSRLNLSQVTNVGKLLSKLEHLNTTCLDSLDCNQTLHSHCHQGIGVCICNNGYKHINDTCSRLLPDNFLGNILASWPFLPILVVFAIMFICLCLVLHLFSRARFRNQSRSIFVNPKALTVAQAQERRLSQLSQLSGGGVRTPRTPHRSPDQSSRSQRSSYSSSVYPHNQTLLGYNYVTTDSVLLKAKSRSNSISSSKLVT